MNKRIHYVEHADGSVTLQLAKRLPYEISKGHRSHNSGAGIHADKRFKRKRGNQQKRQWLDE